MNHPVEYITQTIVHFLILFAVVNGIFKLKCIRCLRNKVWYNSLLIKREFHCNETLMVRTLCFDVTAF